MKTRFLALCLPILFFMLLQTPAANSQTKAGKMHHHQQITIDDQVQSLTTKLALSPQQQEQLRDLLNARAKGRLDAHNNKSKYTAIQNKNRQAVINKKFKDGFKAILTESQWNNYQKLQREGRADKMSK
jgi:hypothetical protein